MLRADGHYYEWAEDKAQLEPASQMSNLPDKSKLMNFLFNDGTWKKKDLDNACMIECRWETISLSLPLQTQGFVKAMMSKTLLRIEMLI